MKELTIVMAGKSKNGNFWAKVETEVDGFLLQGFIKRKETAFEEDEVIEVPSAVVNAIQWQS